MTQPMPATQAALGCPDGGTCHHECFNGCWRVIACEPLSGVFPDDKWPKDVVTMHLGSRYDIAARPSSLKTAKTAITAALQERYGPGWRLRAQVAGLRLEVHPSTLSMMMQDPESSHWASEEALMASFHVPVIVSAALPKFGWRLVVVTEDVLDQGRL